MFRPRDGEGKAYAVHDLSSHSLTPEDLCVVGFEYWTALLSACVFGVLREHGQSFAAELERRSVSRHQAKHFLSGMRKLKLEDESNDVIRCAQVSLLLELPGWTPHAIRAGDP